MPASTHASCIGRVRYGEIQTPDQANTKDGENAGALDEQPSRTLYCTGNQPSMEHKINRLKDGVTYLGKSCYCYVTGHPLGVSTQRNSF